MRIEMRTIGNSLWNFSRRRFWNRISMNLSIFCVFFSSLVMKRVTMGPWIWSKESLKSSDEKNKENEIVFVILLSFDWFSIIFPSMESAAVSLCLFLCLLSGNRRTFFLDAKKTSSFSFFSHLRMGNETVLFGNAFWTLNEKKTWRRL